MRLSFVLLQWFDRSTRCARFRPENQPANTVRHEALTLDPVYMMPAEFENGTKFLRLGVSFTRYRHEKMRNRNANRKSLKPERKLYRLGAVSLRFDETLTFDISHEHLISFCSCKHFYLAQY